MKNIIDWFNSYKRYYIRGKDIVFAMCLLVVLIFVVYYVAYQNGWVDSYQLFDKLRPHRPMQG